MNYRHAFHAGNFADVVKHALLARLIEYLKRKEKPFRVVDTHAGPGRYRLDAEEALRTGEAADGVLRLEGHFDTLGRDPLLAAYVGAVRPDLAEGHYPGSPLIARRLLRACDRLSAYELHPEDAQTLKANFAGDFQVKTIALDGWLALGAHLPPKERRGLVLIDPPFEQPEETDDIAQNLGRALRRWPSGIYAIWYPLKRPAMRDRLHDGLQAAAGDGAVTIAEFLREPYGAEERFVGTGLAVVNAPFVFADEAQAVLDRLSPILGRDRTATAAVFTL